MNLYDYQKEDIAKVQDIDYVLNANKMGYGKTVEAIALMQLWKAQRVLIVCPKAVMDQWAAEIKKWDGRDCIVRPTQIFDKRQIVVINYDKLANGTFIRRSNFKIFEPGPYLQQFFMFQWDLIICDEVHRIKNRDAKVTRALEKLPARRKIGMSGTPILNKPDDLYSILHWLNPKYSGNSYWSFVNKYCKVEDSFFGKKIVGLTDSLERQKELIDLLEPFTIRNPDLILGKGKRVTEIPLTMGAKQKRLYKDIKNLIFDELPENCTVLNGMSKIIRLQQTTSSPELFEVKDNIKAEWLIEMCLSNPEMKFVVFSRFAKTVNLVSEKLKAADISAITYTGDLKMAERNESLRLFKETPVQVLFGTIGALGQGVDGLQQVCHTAIFLDRDWSPALNEQAEDRLNRIGQKELVDIYVLECIGTVDKYVGKININKTIDIRKVLDGNENISI